MSHVGYNCSCDDEYPSRTLEQMREYLMVRLGYAAQLASPPPGMTDLLNSFLQEAQELAYRDYSVFRMERFFTWQMEPDVKFYDLPNNDETGSECTKTLDPRKITWVGVSNDQSWWYPLVCGIRPELYSFDASGWPTHYEIRQCIEVWPPPDSDTWFLRIKGYFELLPFASDTDTTTIDYTAIGLLALANAKAHFGQPDASNYVQQYRAYIGNLTAGSHMTKRYIPGAAPVAVSPNPVWVPLP